MNYLRNILLLLLFAGCSSRTLETDYSFRIYEEDGVTIAETTGGPKYAGELFTYEKMMVLDTGQSDETLLYRPRQFLADEFGNLYIYDAGKRSILMFNSDGLYLRSIGQQGQGPGEIMSGQIQLIREGILQFFDTRLRRTTRFKTDGTLLDITTLPAGVGLLGFSGFMILEDEVQLVLTHDSDMANLGATQRRGAVTISAGGDTLGVVYTPWIQVLKNATIPIQGSSVTAPMPMAFGPFPTSVFHPDHGTVLSMCTLPELQIYNTAGQKIRTIRVCRQIESDTISS